MTTKVYIVQLYIRYEGEYEQEYWLDKEKAEASLATKKKSEWGSWELQEVETRD